MSEESKSLVRFAALSAGTSHHTALEQLLTELNRLEGNEHLLAKQQITQLRDNEIINDKEMELLGGIADALYDDSDLASAVTQVGSLHRELTVNQEASPVAIAIADIGWDALNSAVDESKPIDGKPIDGVVMKEKEKEGKGTATADLMGALAGSTHAVKSGGGLWGGILGGVVGGLGASYLAKRDKAKKNTT